MCTLENLGMFFYIFNEDNGIRLLQRVKTIRINFTLGKWDSIVSSAVCKQ